MAKLKNMHSSSAARTQKLQLTAEQPSTGECWIPPKKRIPHLQGQRRSLNKIVGEAKLCLESNPIPARDAQRAQTKCFAHEENPQRFSQTCP